MLIRSLLIPALLLWTASSLAGEAERQLFVEALGKVEAGGAEAEDFAALRDHVLYPYLEAAEMRRALRKSPGKYTDHRVKAFLDTHQNAAFTGSLRLAWLRRLAKKGQWQLFLDYYPSKASEEMECLAAQAKIKLKQEDAVLAASSLWLHGDNRHKACNPVFSWLEKSGELTQALIDSRVRLAMEAGNHKLVAYLARKQQGKHKRRTDHWLWAYRNPRDAISRLASSGDKKMDADMLRQVFRRLAARERDRAAKLYNKAMARSGVDEKLKQQLAAYLGFRHILNREPEALAWYKRSGNVELRAIESDWRIRSAIYAEAWREVLDWIVALPFDEQKTARWQYWRGRAHIALGEKSAGIAALNEIKDLRDFYGFLAADILGEPYGIVDRPIAVDAGEQQRLKARADVQRAYELWQAGMPDKARAEWHLMLGSMLKENQLQAGVLADDWGWWQMAIISYGKAGYWDDLARRFPAPHRSLYAKQAKRQKIDWAWAYGITRSESMFARDARSPVGALGLMQLMPATAKQVSRNEGIRWRGAAALYEPSRNVRLGVRYLADMLKKFNGHIAMATAAYNAGPHNVNKWRPARDLPVDIWIETVPFGATHSYLRHVLEFTATYEWRLSGKYTRLSQRLPAVKAR